MFPHFYLFLSYKDECDHQRAETLFNDSKPKSLERRLPLPVKIRLDHAQNFENIK